MDKKFNSQGEFKMKKGFKIAIMITVALVFLVLIASSISSCGSNNNSSAANAGIISLCVDCPEEFVQYLDHPPAPPTPPVNPNPPVNPPENGTNQPENLGRSNIGAIIFIVVLLLIAGGGCTYKIVQKIKAKKNANKEESADDERTDSES